LLIVNGARGFAVALATLALILAGCGGGEGGAAFKKGGTPAPRDCLQGWNDSQRAPDLGKHFYLTHQVRGGQLFHFTQKPLGFVDRCVAFFAVKSNDYEFGIVGAADFPGGGWEYVSQTTFPQERPEDLPNMQRRAAQQANVKVGPDGKLTPL